MDSAKIAKEDEIVAGTSYGFLPNLSKHKRTDLKNFTYTTFKLGKDKKKHYVKFPNLEYAKSVSLSRQLLHYNYSFRSSAECRAPKNGIPIAPSRDFQWNKWFEEVRREKDNPRQDFPSVKSIRPTNEVIESRKIHGFPDELVDKIYVHPKRRTLHVKIAESTVIEAESDLVERSSSSEVDIETASWQCENWLKPLVKDYLSVEIQEIYSNLRFLGISSRYSSVKLTPSLTLIYLEQLRNAFYKQDWLLAAKCIEGICTEASTPSEYEVAHRRHWIFWNVGFHCIVRFENGNMFNALNAVRLFASNFDGMFSPRTYPRRLGIEIAIWLTQEGYFLRGLSVLEEMDQLGKKYHNITKKEFFGISNPRRDLIDLIASLIRAVYLYSMWKRDCKMNDEDKFQGDDDDLRRTATNALASFENLLELTMKCDGEITAFLDQLIELTIECRSPNQAKELFDELILKFYGNYFVEKAYATFLKKYFPESASEIFQNLKLEKQFCFEDSPHWKYQRKAILKYQKLMHDHQQPKKSFIKLPNPGFSV